MRKRARGKTRRQIVAANPVKNVSFLLGAAFFSLALSVLAIAISAVEGAAPTKAAFAEDEVLVRFQEGASAQGKANVHARVGGKPVKEFNIVKGLQRIKLPVGMSVEEAVK